jgi:hypothetical protein
MEIKGEILTENSLLEYLFSAHLTLFHNVTQIFSEATFLSPMEKI